MSPVPERINVDWDDEEALPGAWMGNAYDAPMEGRVEYVLAVDSPVKHKALSLVKEARLWIAHPPVEGYSLIKDMADMIELLTQEGQKPPEGGN
jgi:hypothetical protein